MRREVRPRKRWSRPLFVLAVVLAVLVGLTILGADRKKAWPGYGRYTVVAFGNGAMVRTFDPITRDAIELSVPADLELQSANSRGRWKVSAIEELAGKYGWRWAAQSVADELGFGFTAVQSEQSWWDKLVWWKMTRGVAFRHIDMDQTAFVASRKDVDDTTVLGLDSRWDDQVRDYFLATDIASERLTLSVINTTDIPGVATKAARVLESAGIRVIEVDSLKQDEANCKIALPKAAMLGISVRYIQQQFGCSVERTTNLDTVLYVGTQLGERLGS